MTLSSRTSHKILGLLLLILLVLHTEEISATEGEKDSTELASPLVPYAPLVDPVPGCEFGQSTLFGGNITVFNLGPKINTKYSEYNSVLNEKESFMLFTARRDSTTGEEVYPEDGLYFEDILITEKKNGIFKQSQGLSRTAILPYVINTSKHEAPVFLAWDEQKLIVYKEDKLWYSDRVDTGFSLPVEYPKNVNIGNYQRHASYTGDGSKMYFSSEVKDQATGRRNYDIFVSEKQEDGTWGKGVKMDFPINTAYNEDSPEISKDGKLMYFSSERLGGYGGYDIYFTEYIDSSDSWTTPVNLCEPINSPAHDIYFKISRDRTTAYFSSNRLGGYGAMDIYKVILDIPTFANCLPYSDGVGTVEVDASQSVDGLGVPLTYLWDFGDGSTATGLKVRHTYKEPGKYKIKLNTKDPETGATYYDDYISEEVEFKREYDALVMDGPDTVQVGEPFIIDGSRSRIQDGEPTNWYWNTSEKVVKNTSKLENLYERPGLYEVQMQVSTIDEERMIMEYQCVTRKVYVMRDQEFVMWEKDKKKQFTFKKLLSDNEILLSLDNSLLNNPLELKNDIDNTQKGTPVTTDVLENDVHPTGLDLDVTLLTRPQHGYVQIKNAENGYVTYVPNPTFTGIDQFRYTAVDEDGTTSQAFVVIRVMDDEAYTSGIGIQKDYRTTGVNQVIDVNVLENDVNPDGVSQKVKSASQPVHGSVEVIDAEKGIVKYIPKNGFKGRDAFVYTILTADGAEASTLVVIDISDKYGNPILEGISARSDYKETAENEPVTVNLLANDIHPYGLDQEIIAVSTPPNGKVKILDPKGGNVLYMPNKGFTGSDAFVYSIRDSKGLEITDGATIVVKGDERLAAFELTPDFNTTETGVEVITPVLKNDVHKQGLQFKVVSVTEPSNGGAYITDMNKGLVAYISDPGFIGRDVFTYTAQDEKGVKATSTVTITVVGEGDYVMVLADDRTETSMDQPVEINVLDNDKHSKGYPMTVTAVGSPSNGVASIENSKSGLVRYRPKFGFTGKDVFTYEVRDSKGKMASAQVFVTVIAPVALTDVDTLVKPELALEPIYFDFDKSYIRAGDAQEAMARNIKKLKEHPEIVIKVLSHCDSRGSHDYNIALSERRANSTVAWLVKNGISKERVFATVGLGETQLSNDCGDGRWCPPQDHQKNRRSDLVIVGSVKK